MKRILFFAAALLALVGNTTTLSAQDIEQESITLTQRNIQEIHSSLPTLITVTAEDSDHITITIPMEAIPYVEFDIDHLSKVLSIKHSESYSSRKQLESIYNNKTPIDIRVPSSSITDIMNTSDMSITFENSSVGNWFQVINTGTMFIHGEALNAKDKIEFYNTGTLTSKIKYYNTSILCLTNTGFLLTSGSTTAKHIDQNSTGIENTNLEVACEKITIASTGSGVIRYHGTADDVEVTSTGKAHIRTSELNAE
jgi:hypothetical protein